SKRDWSSDVCSSDLAYGDHCYMPPLGGDIRCDLVVRDSSGGNPRVLLPSFRRRNTGLWPAAWTPDSRTLLHSGYGDTGHPALFEIGRASCRERVWLS